MMPSSDSKQTSAVSKVPGFVGVYFKMIMTLGVDRTCIEFDHEEHLQYLWTKLTDDYVQTDEEISCNLFSEYYLLQQIILTEPITGNFFICLYIKSPVNFVWQLWDDDLLLLVIGDRAD